VVRLVCACPQAPAFADEDVAQAAATAPAPVRPAPPSAAAATAAAEARLSEMLGAVFPAAPATGDAPPGGGGAARRVAAARVSAAGHRTRVERLYTPHKGRERRVLLCMVAGVWLRRASPPPRPPSAPSGPSFAADATRVGARPSAPPPIPKRRPAQL